MLIEQNELINEVIFKAEADFSDGSRRYNI
jgi:hypothetical protein